MAASETQPKIVRRRWTSEDFSREFRPLYLRYDNFKHSRWWTRLRIQYLRHLIRCLSNTDLVPGNEQFLLSPLKDLIAAFEDLQLGTTPPLLRAQRKNSKNVAPFSAVNSR